MKKLNYLLLFFILGTTVLANPVTKNSAQAIGLSFFKQHSSAGVSAMNLAYTETSSSGEPVYFVFNINSNDGFVIVAADDAAHPIIGYSTKGAFVIPTAHSTVGSWLKKRKAELLEIRSKNYKATAEISNEWSSGNMTIANRIKSGAKALPTAVAPMVKTTWNQNPYYNDLCPGGSVTGCVATAMAQIMRFWNYPARGTGSSSYCDCTSSGDTEDYGVLSANYGATTYNWANMPLAINAPNADVANLCYQCGVSVNMDYAPSGSGAWVITADTIICAQTSYVKYFGYDPSTIQGLVRSNYSDSLWLSMIENDLSIGRPVQYVGVDTSAGGHTWVCDGYDASDLLDMNWGWAGQDDGYFSINKLNPSSYNFAVDQEVLLGIRPMPKVANDAGVYAIVSPTTAAVCSNIYTPVVSVANFGDSTLTSCVINYVLDAGSLQTQNWSGSLAANASMNVTLAGFTAGGGSHTLVSYTTLPNGLPDGNGLNDTSIVSFYNNSVGAVLPVIQGFEASPSLPTGWTLYDFPDSLVTWQVSNTVAYSGNNSIGFNNCQGEGNTSMKGRRDRFITSSFDFSATPSGSLGFDVAYTTVIYKDTVYADTLAVYYSIDCGVSWNRIYYKGGATLATAPQYTSVNNCWSPTSTSEWRIENIGLTALAGQPSVMFAFESRSEWGEYIYIDNINISTTLTAGISEINASAGLFVYPNPASSSLTLSGTDNAGKVYFTISDLSGREVMAGDIDAAAGSFNQTISISDLAHGVYIIKANDTKNAWVKKIVVE
jgi:hypothetical protein